MLIDEQTILMDAVDIDYITNICKRCCRLREISGQFIVN